MWLEQYVPRWQLIETAPVEQAEKVPSFYQFRCLLQSASEMGATARFTSEVTMALVLWRSKEINRETHGSHIGHALLRGFQAEIGSHILQYVEPSEQAEVAFGIATDFLSGLLRLLSSKPEDLEKFSTRIGAIEAGRA